MKRMKQGKRNKKEKTNTGLPEKDTAVSADMAAEGGRGGCEMDKLAMTMLSIFITATDIMQLKAQALKIRVWTLLQTLPTALSLCLLFFKGDICLWQREPTVWILFVEVHKKEKLVLYIVRICSLLFEVFYVSADGMFYFLLNYLTIGNPKTRQFFAWYYDYG